MPPYAPARELYVLESLYNFFHKKTSHVVSLLLMDAEPFFRTLRNDMMQQFALRPSDFIHDEATCPVCNAVCGWCLDPRCDGGCNETQTGSANDPENNQDP